MTTKTSEAASIRRIRRWLAASNYSLRIPRSERDWNQYGIHIIDHSYGCITATRCDIDELFNEMIEERG